MPRECRAAVIALFLSLVASPGAYAAPVAATAGVPMIAVMPLSGEGIDASASRIVTDALADELMQTGLVRVMERGQMEKILAEQGFQKSGACEASQCAVEVGKLLSIDRMVVGTLGKLGASYSISVRMVSVSTGEVMGSARRLQKGEIENVVNEMLPSVTQDLLGKVGSAKPSRPYQAARKDDDEEKPDYPIDSATGWKKRTFRVTLGGSFNNVLLSNNLDGEGITATDGSGSLGMRWGVSGLLRVAPKVDVGAGFALGYQSYNYGYTTIKGNYSTSVESFLTELHASVDYRILPRFYVGGELGYVSPSVGTATFTETSAGSGLSSYGSSIDDNYSTVENAPNSIRTDSDYALIDKFYAQSYPYLGLRLGFQPAYRLLLDCIVRIPMNGIIAKYEDKGNGTATLNDGTKTNNVVLNEIGFGIHLVF